MLKKLLFLSLFLLQIIISFSQTKSKLNIEIEKLKTEEPLKHAVWGICIMPVEKDTILTEYNSNISLIPASTLKIVTTGAALSLLGNDFKFETKLQYDGTFDSLTGIIKGNLYIIGGGDPTLESEYFKDEKDSLSITDKWAELLKKKGIKKITGAVIGDASVFDNNTIPPQWIWADIGNYFGAGACGLTYHDNKYTLYFNSGTTGSKTTITKTKPVIDNLQLVNNVISGGSDDYAFIYGAPYSYYRKVEGTIPANKTNYEVDGSIPDPALFCAQSLDRSLKNSGIAVEGKATTMRLLNESLEFPATNQHLLHTHYSPTLDQIVYWTNFKSINLYAEHLLKILAYKKDLTQEGATTLRAGMGKEKEGTEIITDFWKNKGIDMGGFFMNDGCGLSRSNVITAKTEVQILRMMAKNKTFKPFYNSFPVAGKAGSLENMCEGSFASNNLCAKSGYITRARGYAGYVKNKKGEMLCFSMLANNYECTPGEMKRYFEKLLVAIADLE